MILKDTLPHCTVRPKPRIVQKLVRRWYVVEGETGASWGKDIKGMYTHVTQAVDSFKEAKKLETNWRNEHVGVWSRIIRIDETRTAIITNPPDYDCP